MGSTRPFGQPNGCTPRPSSGEQTRTSQSRSSGENNGPSSERPEEDERSGEETPLAAVEYDAGAIRGCAQCRLTRDSTAVRSEATAHPPSPSYVPLTRCARWLLSSLPPLCWRFLAVPPGAAIRLKPQRRKVGTQMVAGTNAMRRDEREQSGGRRQAAHSGRQRRGGRDTGSGRLAGVVCAMPLTWAVPDCYSALSLLRTRHDCARDASFGGFQLGLFRSNPNRRSRKGGEGQLEVTSPQIGERAGAKWKPPIE
jgi:hypothetical protein